LLGADPTANSGGEVGAGTHEKAMTNPSHSPAPGFLAGTRAALSAVERLLLAVASLCVLAMILVTAIDVVGRYAFNRALGWAYDGALVLMIGLVFLSISSLQATRSHIAVEVMYQYLPPSVKFVLACVQFAAGAFGFGLIGWKNTEYAMEAAKMGWVYGGFGAVPTWVPYGFIGAGCLLMTLRLVLQLVVVVFEGRGSLLLSKTTVAEPSR